MKISLDSADLIIEGAKHKALQIGAAVAIAVLDDGGHLKAFAKMDGAMLGSIGIAIGKAKSAVLFGMNTEDLSRHARGTAGGSALSAGGIPLRSGDGELIGAVGVSGGTAPEDFSVAMAGADALESL